MFPWEHGPLRVTENGRYFENGTQPFFWLGDTAWQLFAKLNPEDTELYLQNRARKGFNVILAVLVHELDQSEGSGRLPDRCHTGAEYWQQVRRTVARAQALGLYIGLLPAWGKLLRTGELNPGNAARYADFLGQFFQPFPNIVWVLGGDVRGDVSPETTALLARTLKKWNPDRLVGYHPFGRTSSSQWFAQAPWLDFNLFQSGHRRYDQRKLNAWDEAAPGEEWFGEDNWRYVRQDHARVNKPTLDGEPSYEGIRQGLHSAAEPYWEAPDVRRYAWWSVLEGAAGHTYGHSAIMQFYTGGKGAYGVRETWRDALHAEGSAQMAVLHRVMEGLDFVSARPAPGRVAKPQGERYARVSVLAGSGFVLSYSFLGQPFVLELAGLFPAGFAYGCWVDPCSGVYSWLGKICTKGCAEFLPPPRRTGSRDWLLLLTARPDPGKDEGPRG